MLVDGHNDLPWRLRTEFDSRFERFDLARRHEHGHTDIPRLRAGGVDVQFFAAYVPPERSEPAAVALEQIALVRRMAARYADFELADTAEDARRIAAAGRIAVFIAVEGGHTIENSTATLRRFRELGARYLTLTHASTTDWADAATDEPRHGGLTEFGERVVREMNRLGMLVDISHVSDDTMRHVLRISRAPVIASHSGARAVNAHERNVPDDVLRRMADAGGVVMVNFYPGFVVPEAAEVARRMFDAARDAWARHGGDEAAVDRAVRAWSERHPIPRGTVAHVVDHIDHIVRVAGIDHVGLGSDFDGITVTPAGLGDVSAFPAITEELVRRGYGEREIARVLGGNALRVLAEAEAVARSLN